METVETVSLYYRSDEAIAASLSPDLTIGCGEIFRTVY